MNKHIIDCNKSILDAISQINGLSPEPLVLFIKDEANCIIGALTDGDIRRALIAGKSLQERVEKAMHRDFYFLKDGLNDNVKQIKELKRKKIKLVPILDNNRHIVDIVDLERFKSQLPIDAVIMAGGKGERLRPLTEKTPKPLLKVGDKAIIDYNVENLLTYGVKNIYVTVNYLKEQLEEHFLYPKEGVQIRTIREPNYLGTIGSLKYIENYCHDTILLMNSDLFTNIDFEDFYLHFREHDADMSAAAVPFSVSVPYGIFQIHDKRVIDDVLEKPTYNYYANAGIYLIKRKMIEKYIPKDIFFNATDFIEKLISEQKKVIRFPISGYWIDIGNMQDYQKAQDIVKHL